MIKRNVGLDVTKNAGVRVTKNAGLRVTKNAGVLGIDFGTSNSAIAWAPQAGIVTPLAVEGTATAMPTALFFDAEENRVQFGRAAVANYLSGTDGRLMRSLKSLLGSSLLDESTEIFGRSTRFSDIIGFYLAELKARAEQSTGAKINTVWIGRPVHFVDDDPEKDAKAQNSLQAAAESVGFKNVHFQFEPIAAAIDFESRLTVDATVLIADIGGGTSDFSVLRLGPDRQHEADRSSDVLATAGVHIAGTDFDTSISLETVMPLLGYRHVGLRGREVPRSVFHDLSTWHRIHFAQTLKSINAARMLDDTYSNLVMYQRLLKVLKDRLGHHIAADVEQCKIASSSSGGEPIYAQLDYIEANLSVAMQEDQIVELLRKHLDGITQCAKDCVKRSGLKANELTHIYLTGGSSALTAFQRALKKTFPNAQLIEGDLFGGVAAGLARQGSRS